MPTSGNGLLYEIIFKRILLQLLIYLRKKIYQWNTLKSLRVWKDLYLPVCYLLLPQTGLHVLPLLPRIEWLARFWVSAGSIFLLAISSSAHLAQVSGHGPRSIETYETLATGIICKWNLRNKLYHYITKSQLSLSMYYRCGFYKCLSTYWFQWHSFKVHAIKQAIMLYCINNVWEMKSSIRMKLKNVTIPNVKVHLPYNS